MKIKVRNSQLNGNIAVPGSKSHTIRAIAIATAAHGTSIIHSPLISQDTLSCLNAAQALGAVLKEEQDTWIITGTKGHLLEPSNIIDMGNSGTSLRIFTGLAAMGSFPVTFDGDASLKTRPMKPLLNSLRELGVKINANDEKCPLTINGPAKGGQTTIDGKSSQFLTSLLIALPLAENNSIINVKNLNEKPYIEITLDWLKKQGIKLEHSGNMERFHIQGKQHYKAFESIIPADFSTAAFPLVAAALTKGRIQINNLDFQDRQGDKIIFNYIKQIGANIAIDNNTATITPSATLHGCEFDLNATPDALPVMAVAGAYIKGTTSLINCPQARIKETDRIKCMTCELRKMGAEIEELNDGMIIHGGNKLRGCTVDGYDDHRIVMALTIAGMLATGETIINGAEAASVTYPTFIEDFSRMGSDIRSIT